MTIDPIVPLVERVVIADRETSDGTFFSYRHAPEIHALGLKHEFTSDSPWSQVCVSILVSAFVSPKIWVRVLWSRPKLEFPKEECSPREFPLSEAGAHLFADAWPTIRRQLAHAIVRGHPPEND
jgi:hypothetical protein